MVENANCVILDPGSGTIKFGISHLDSASHQQVYQQMSIPSIYGTSRYAPAYSQFHSKVESGTYHRNYQIGKHVHMFYDILDVIHPVQRGVVTDWDVVMTILEDGIKLLDTNSNNNNNNNNNNNKNPQTRPEDLPSNLFVSEPWFCPRTKREKMVEIAFEKCDYEKFYSVPQTVLTLLNHDKISGYVLESGYGQTQFTPIFEGHKVQQACFNFNKGGSDLTLALAKLVEPLANHFLQLNTIEKNVVQGNMTFESIHPFQHYYELEAFKINPSDAHSVLTKNFSTPDLYNNIFFFNQNKSASGDNKKDSEEEKGENKNSGDKNEMDLVEMIEDSFKLLNSDENNEINNDNIALLNLVHQIPQELYIGGGNASNNYFQSKLAWESNVLHVNPILDDEYEWSVWKGGSKFVSSPNMDTFWIKNKEYYETGPNIINLCCL